MKIKLLNFLLIFLLGVGFITGTSNAEGKGGKKNNGLNKTTGLPNRTFLDINSLSTQIYNDGNSDIDPSGNSGVVFPIGSGKTAVFESGLLWGMKIPGDPNPRVGGSSYNQGLQGGKILSPGVAEDPDLAKNRIYRVRPDVYPGGPDISLPTVVTATTEGSDAAAILAQYRTDWTEWPWQDGAPYYDGNHNGVYDPVPDPVDSLRDIPGVQGADQTIWFVANDLDVGKSTDLYGTLPVGMEMQATIWAYSQSGALGSMFFRRYKLINKGTTEFDSMYVSMWSDVDLGNSTDDFAGCDTLLSLGYCYNANAIDATYSPLPPPAVGFDFFQGPIVNSPGDTAFVSGTYYPDKKVLPMTSFYYFARGDASVTDPTLSDPEGARQFYNFFQGKIGLTGQYFVNPVTNQPTTFVLSGNPQTGQGWVDGNPLSAGDRRIGMASGPFTMAVGDTQEVVVAEIVAGAIPGTDRLSAIGLLKFFDQFAQLSYDNNFQLPPAPPRPVVTPVELPNKIVLDWGEDASKVQATESFAQQGYRFEGYNVYQLPSASSTIEDAKRIATFDVVNDDQVILSKEFDPSSGQILLQPKQFGTNSGLKRYLEITQDQIKGGTPLINGIKYYYAVTAYGVIEGYDPKVPFDSVPTVTQVENPLSIITVVPHSVNPGVTTESQGEYGGVTHTEGTADGGVVVNVVDPSKLTGDEYQIYFTERNEIRDMNGNWVPSPDGRPSKPDTLSGSTIDVTPYYGTEQGLLELHFSLDLVSSDEDYADGISMTFPAGVEIVSAPKFEAGNGSISPKIDGNTVTMGDITHPYTGSGPFAGGEEWIIVVRATSPFPVDWTIFDDGYGGGPLDESGTTTVSSDVQYLTRTAKYWNLKDLTTGAIKLENQSIINGIDIYPDRDDINTIPGAGAVTVIDGFQVNLTVSYEAPIEFLSTSLSSPTGLTTLTHESSTSTLDVQNYTIYGTATSTALEGFGVGTDDINELQKDYELRFTGVWDSTEINGQTVYYVKSGGQMATLFSGVNSSALANHPLNPNPGTNAPFLIRIPFEVWSIDDNRQVNLAFRDREQVATADPFYAWDPHHRNYAVLINSAYDSVNAIPMSASNSQNALATWNLVFYGLNYHEGDILTVTYQNPVQIGMETYTFKPSAVGYSVDKAKVDINAVNVFPNPYYGVNSEELNKYNRFVTFTHLPAKATVRIFNLAGILVKTIEKNDAGQFLRWDLANQSGLPVASGLYIAYIEMPDLGGATKILKLAIIQEQQILDRF